MTIAETASLRAAAYRLCASLLLPPDEQRLRRALATAQALAECDAALAGFAFHGVWRRLLVALQTLEEADVRRLQEEHVRLFFVNPTGAPCFPYESCYLAPDAEATSWIVAELGRAYASAGLRLAPAGNESPDHAAVELEFMAFLCGQEADAWQRSDTTDGLRLLRQQRVFLRTHLRRWFGLFARDVRVTAGHVLYGAAVGLADGLIHHDLDLIDALTGEIERWLVGHDGEEVASTNALNRDVRQSGRPAEVVPMATRGERHARG